LTIKKEKKTIITNNYLIIVYNSKENTGINDSLVALEYVNLTKDMNILCEYYQIQI